MENYPSQTLSVSNGEQVWQLVESELPDTLIANVLTPILDSYEVTGSTKAEPAVAKQTVFLLASKAAYDSLVASVRRGAVAYVTKPFYVDELSGQLQDLHARQQNLRNSFRNKWAFTTPTQSIEKIQDSWLQTLYKVLETHLDDPLLNVGWLAEQMAMSRKTLLRKVQSLTRLSPNELIRYYRLHKASDLLRAGHNVSETAYLVGFETPAYFGHCFKDYYQITPSEFAHSAT